MKLWPREQNLVRNILKLKYLHQVSSEHVQTVYILGRSELTNKGRQRENKSHVLPWDLEVISAWNFP